MTARNNDTDPCPCRQGATAGPPPHMRPRPKPKPSNLRKVTCPDCGSRFWTNRSTDVCIACEKQRS
jgi:hypothetical protein